MPQPINLHQPTAVLSTLALRSELQSYIGHHQVTTYEGYFPTQQKSDEATYELIDPDGMLSRLLAAAVINRRLRRMLLTNPGAAVAAGYQGEFFVLSADELQVLLPLKANTLAEFSQLLLQAIDEHNRRVTDHNRR